jgi:hypothetical protein
MFSRYLVYGLVVAGLRGGFFKEWSWGCGDG